MVPWWWTERRAPSGRSKVLRLTEIVPTFVVLIVPEVSKPLLVLSVWTMVPAPGAVVPVSIVIPANTLVEVADQIPETSLTK